MTKKKLGCTIKQVNTVNINLLGDWIEFSMEYSWLQDEQVIYFRKKMTEKCRSEMEQHVGNNVGSKNINMLNQK